MLRCPHKRIVTITKVHIARNNIHVELIRFRKKIAILLILETLKWELGPIVLRLLCLRNWAHCYPGRVATVLSWWRRTFRDMTTSVHSHFGISHISRQARFRTVLFQVTMYRQFARKVGPSANTTFVVATSQSPRVAFMTRSAIVTFAINNSGGTVERRARGRVI